MASYFTKRIAQYVEGRTARSLKAIEHAQRATEERELLKAIYDLPAPEPWTPTTTPKATHIAGYVPPKGSIAMQFLGNVIRYR